MTKQFGTPGPRAIHPEMCDSPSLGQCGVLANALLPRLVAMADDQGRLAGDAYGVLVACMGRHMRLVTVDATEAALAELEEAEIVERYAVKGHPYLQLVSWWRWQSGQRRAYPSRWPAPRGWVDLVYGCAAGGALNRFEEALAATPRRNAAIRGIPQQSAAERSNPPPRARPPVRPPVRAHAVPLPDTMPSPARGAANGAAARGGPPSSTGDEVSNFRKKAGWEA